MKRNSASPSESKRRRPAAWWWAALAVVVGACASPSALPHEAAVRRVIDGDTIQLSDGQLVRYIGIDAPETRRREGARWVEAPEPFGPEATQANRRLVEGQRVRLEYDVQTHDRYGRLLAYVYVGERMINADLVEGGYATTLTIPPDVRFAERFQALAATARREKRGLWRAASAP